MDTVRFLERWARGDRSQSIDQNSNQVARGSVSLAPTKSTNRPSDTPQESKGRRSEQREESTTKGYLDAPSTSLEFLSEERPGLSGTPSGQSTNSGTHNGQKSRDLLKQQVEMEHAALSELKSVRDAAAQRIELWKQFCQVYDQLNSQE